MKRDAPINETRVESDADNVDRIVLKRAEALRLDQWITTLNVRYSGMIRFTKSDLANFLIRNHSTDLDTNEMEALALELYDEVRWLNWALVKIRKAKKEGVTLSLDDLVILRKPGKVAMSRPSKKRHPVNRSNEETLNDPEIRSGEPVKESHSLTDSKKEMDGKTSMDV